ncbi:putative metalloprotease with PDZ domain [Brevundimonas alba]|uniref:Putative metalloprotease with PDZ domain n=1 Tax=Brevundimonas alba TaxID=74314 RepID=A0A7X5YGY3_9CAUL|nr:peptidase M61 [Brevundimonas alba]NJC39753.1 putative metalloprotease with PDZ domain [Brevundimonas alba]
MLRSAALALLIAGAALPASAQISQAQTPLPAPTSLPHALPPIPAPQDRDYPGVIGIRTDLTDLDHQIIRVRQTVPVSTGHLVLQYPKFIPGNHADTGPIQLISGVTVTGNGQRIEWVRDTVDPYAFHLDIPAGVTSIEVAFEWLTQPSNAVWRVVMTPEMVNLQWEKALLYPAGYNHSRITFAPSVTLPAGWQQGSALEVAGREGDVITFKPISLEHLADSPMFAGAHYRRIDLDPGGRSPVHLNLLADTQAGLAATDEQIAKFRAMVDQTDYLFGARHYDRYDFLLAASDELGGIGLEHHRSSENTAPADFFTNGMRSFGTLALLPHEFTHSWNGKFRRPSDEYVPNLNVPTQNSLMWVYEGQTEYWGEVLTARSGLATKEEQLATIAEVAAFYENQPGREWRALQDTTNHNLLGYRTTNPYSSWMRGTGDYYREALLIWLDADTLIREATNNRKSLDDFAKAFFGVEDGVWEARPYTFDDVVRTLNAVHPYDWATFLRSRLDAVGPDAKAPLDGIARAGYRLSYVDSLTPTEKRVQGGWATDFQYSLGFSLGSGNRITGVRWGGLAYEQGIGAGWELVAVGDRAASAEALRSAVTAAKDGTQPIVLVVKRGDEFRTLSFDYHGGLRYPRLERVAGTPDRLGDILTPRRR